MDAIQNERMPPDWIYTHEKELKRQEWETERRRQATSEVELREPYRVERFAALQAYLNTTEGRSQFESYEPTFREFDRTVEPDRFREAAREAAAGKVEREHFQHPDFGVWLLERHPLSAG